MTKITGYVESMWEDGLNVTRIKFCTILPESGGGRFGHIEIAVLREEGHNYRIGQPIEINIAPSGE